MTKSFSPPPSNNRGGGLFVPIQDRGEPGVPRISNPMKGDVFRSRGNV